MNEHMLIIYEGLLTFSDISQTAGGFGYKATRSIRAALVP